MTYFLLVYDRPAGALLSITTYTDGRSALAARLDEERVRVAEPDIEIVVLSATSQDELRKTHARYFQGPVDLVSDMIDQEEPEEAKKVRRPFWGPRRADLAVR
jgi:hypothetical protein